MLFVLVFVGKSFELSLATRDFDLAILSVESQLVAIRNAHRGGLAIVHIACPDSFRIVPSSGLVWIIEEGARLAIAVIGIIEGHSALSCSIISIQVESRQSILVAHNWVSGVACA